MTSKIKTKAPLMNFNNFKDKNYVMLIIAELVISCVISVIYSTVLDFMALSLKHANNNVFYDYASIANAVGLIPGILSFIIGILIVNYSFKSLAKYFFIMGTILSLLLYFLQSANYFVIAVYVAVMFILIGALGLSINKLIYRVLQGRYEDYISDLLIIAGICSSICYKFSGLLYEKFGCSYIFFVTIAGLLVLHIIGNLSDTDENAGLKIGNQLISKQENVLAKIKLITKHYKLILFLILANMIGFFTSSFQLLVTTLTYHLNFGTSVYASAFGLVPIAGLVTALIFKINILKMIDKSKIFFVSVFSAGLLFVLVAIVQSPQEFYVGMLFYGIANVMFQLSLSPILFNYISNSKELVEIAPFIQGLTVSSFTLTGLMSTVTVNMLLKNSYSYNYLLVGFGIMLVILAIITMRYQTLRSRNTNSVSIPQLEGAAA